MGKTLKIEFMPRERFAVFVHFTRNVATRTSREQDEYDDIWSALALDDIDDVVMNLGRDALVTDFPLEGGGIVAELTKEEIGYFVKFLGQPMPGVTSRLIRPIRLKICEARDKAGLKAAESEEAAS